VAPIQPEFVARDESQVHHSSVTRQMRTQHRVWHIVGFIGRATRHPTPLSTVLRYQESLS
jgi:hypothetical protein